MALWLAVALVAAAVGRAAAAPPLDGTPVTGGAFFQREDSDGHGFAIRNFADGPAFYDT